jgi:formate dehydrogenase subunit gamma
MEERTVLRYRKRTVVLHWVHTLAFLILVVTGGIMFFRGSGFVNYLPVANLHRAAAVLFVAIPVIFSFIEPVSTAGFIKETFRWNKDDLKWWAAVPGYYFGGSEEKMPPQGHLNTGQKLWQLTVVVTGILFVITGIILWFFKFSVPVPVYQWIFLAHGIFFVIVFLMFLLHVYMGVFHPRFKEALGSILDGKISPAYARKHFRKWYDKISS